MAGTTRDDRPLGPIALQSPRPPVPAWLSSDLEPTFPSWIVNRYSFNRSTPNVCRWDRRDRGVRESVATRLQPAGLSARWTLIDCSNAESRHTLSKRAWIARNIPLRISTHSRLTGVILWEAFWNAAISNRCTFEAGFATTTAVAVSSTQPFSRTRRKTSLSSETRRRSRHACVRPSHRPIQFEARLGENGERRIFGCPTIVSQSWSGGVDDHPAGKGECNFSPSRLVTAAHVAVQAQAASPQPISREA